MKYAEAKLTLIRGYLAEEFHRANGNVTKMAEAIGVSRTSAQKLLARHSIFSAKMRSDYGYRVERGHNP